MLGNASRKWVSRILGGSIPVALLLACGGNDNAPANPAAAGSRAGGRTAAGGSNEVGGNRAGAAYGTNSGGASVTGFQGGTGGTGAGGSGFGSAVSGGIATGGTTTAGSGMITSAGMAGQGAGARVVPTRTTSVDCGYDGWCWSNPWPVGAYLGALWMNAASDVWIGGELGTLLHFDGSQLSRIALAWGEDITSLWSSGSSDVWAVGDRGTLLHFDGSQWWDYSMIDPSAFYSAVWGSGPNDVLVGGLDGTFYRFNGTSWAPEPLNTTADVRSIWGMARDDVWIAASTGFYHYDGAAWSAISSPVGEGGYATFGIASDNVWSATQQAVLKWNGTAWQDTALAKTVLERFDGIWVDGAGTAYTVVGRTSGAQSALARYSSGTWTRDEPTLGVGSISTLMGVSGGPLWIVGARGLMLRVGGQSFESLTTDVTNLDIGTIAVRGPNDVWAAGTAPMRFDGLGWTVQAQPSGTSAPAVLWAPSASELWNIRKDGSIYTWNGVAWARLIGISTVPASTLRAAWGTGANCLYVAGSAGVRWLGTAWESVGPSNYFDVWGSGPNDVWLVGGTSSRDYAHWNGTAWTRFSEASRAAAYLGVWGSGPNDVWAVGQFGLIHHYAGVGFTEVSFGDDIDLNKIWGSGPNDVWAVGNAGLIRHWNGSAWSTVQSGTDRNLRAIAGIDANDVWAAGVAGVILRRK